MIRNMLDFLGNTASRCPDRAAFYDDRESLTFRQLADTARRIGTRLAAVTRPRQTVALLLDARSIRHIPSMFCTL